MRKNVLGWISGSLIAVMLLTACAPKEVVPATAESQESIEDTTEIPLQTSEGEEAASTEAAKVEPVQSEDYGLDFTPSVAPYKTEQGLANIENKDRLYLQDDMIAKLVENNFVVLDTEYNEFFDLYENNRYVQTPSFITVDSMMHTYHLYFAMLQKGTEKKYLTDTVNRMSTELQKASVEQYQTLKGSEWEKAALTNVVFFSVGADLLGEKTDIPSEASSLVDEEEKLIMDAEDVLDSPLTGSKEDYTQYKPRGYYDGDEELEKYFRAMMWYGRRNFSQKEEDMDRSALLMTLAIDQNAKEDWETVYTITSFFAGTSDDSGYHEYLPLIEKAFGENAAAGDLIGKEEEFQSFHKMTAELEPPKINSEVFMDDDGKTDKTERAKGFRFMGQRFSIDEAIFTQLCYSKVKENPNGDTRMLPDALDVPAAFGSAKAQEILEDQGAFSYAGYKENLTALQKEVEQTSESTWKNSLYGSWMSTLRPLIKEKGEGYPSFMQNEEWKKKDLEGFLSSYTELKHDTVLYSKQFMAEMGGGDEKLDDRGYVEPEPEVFARLSALAGRTASGLEEFKILDDGDKENLEKLSELAERLKDISIKELTNDTITEEDYELIRTYGGNLEHFWEEATKDSRTGEDAIDSSVVPAAIAVDVATDPNGAVLEQAVGGVGTIFVTVPVEGKLRIAQGAVFRYYQFVQPIEDRLTDSEWRRKLGLELNDNYEYEKDETIKQPEWTQSYHCQWK